MTNKEVVSRFLKYKKPKMDKVGYVMGEFKRGVLRSGSGKKVKNRKQAIAIALSESRKHARK